MCLVAAAASWLRGGRYVFGAEGSGVADAATSDTDVVVLDAEPSEVAR
jgi:hypothetical protein